MNIEVFFSPREVENEYDLREKSVLAVDVLRASSSIITAMHHGARQVIPVASVADAMRLSKDLFEDSTMLCGERGGKLIEGFDLDNSPASYRPERVKDKSLIFTSTNGSGAILRARYALETYVAAFVTVSAAVGAVAAREQVAVICAGEENHFALEDAICAGMIVSRLMEKRPDATVADGARAALMVYDRCSENILAAVRSADHAAVLEREGFGADVTFCATRDLYTVVPVYDGTVIRSVKQGKRAAV
jgi:2-phosphosulfolactate phosphatase